MTTKKTSTPTPSEIELGDEYIYVEPGRVPARGKVKGKLAKQLLFDWDPPVVAQHQKLPLTKWFFKVPKGEKK